MRELNIDLNKYCWSKLDFSHVTDKTKLFLYDKPMEYTEAEFRKIEDLQYGYSIIYENEGTIILIGRSTEENEGTDMQISLFYRNNWKKLNSLFKTNVILFQGLPMSYKYTPLTM